MSNDQSSSIAVDGAAAAAPGISVGQGQPGECGIGAALDKEDAKRQRAAGTAPLNRRTISVDGQRTPAIGIDLWQSVDAIVPGGEGIGSVDRKFNRVVLSVAVGRRDGVLESGHVAIGDVEGAPRRD